jgi:hypothetical protein
VIPPDGPEGRAGQDADARLPEEAIGEGRTIETCPLDRWEDVERALRQPALDPGNRVQASTTRSRERNLAAGVDLGLLAGRA